MDGGVFNKNGSVVVITSKGVLFPFIIILQFLVNNVYGLEFVNCGPISFHFNTACLFLLLFKDSSCQARQCSHHLRSLNSNPRISNQAACR